MNDNGSQHSLSKTLERSRRTARANSKSSTMINPELEAYVRDPDSFKNQHLYDFKEKVNQIDGDDQPCIRC